MNALMGEAEAKVGEQTYHLVMNNQAWVAVEEVLDASYLDTIAYLVQCEIEGKSPKLRTTGALLWAATRDHHPEMTLSECRDLVMGNTVEIMAPLGKAIRNSIKVKDDPEPGEATPPAGAAEDGTGSKPSKATRKPAAEQ